MGKDIPCEAVYYMVRLVKDMGLSVTVNIMGASRDYDDAVRGALAAG